MNAVKERILGAVTVMNNVDALKLWHIISEEFSNFNTQWASVPEVDADSIDLEMLNEIETDNDCREFIPAAEAEKILGLL